MINMKSSTKNVPNTNTIQSRIQRVFIVHVNFEFKQTAYNNMKGTYNRYQTLNLK